MKHREIKFRAWDESQKRMILGPTGNSVSSEWVFTAFSCGVFPHVTLMQSTGLKDSKGVDIYEGDILSGHSDGNVLVKWVDNGAHFECQFSDEASIGLDEMCVWFGNHSIVIGNIFSNPELIEP